MRSSWCQWDMLITFAHYNRSTAHYWKLAKHSRGLASEDCQRPTAGSSYQHSLRQMIRGWKRGTAFKKRKSRRPCLLLHGVPHFRCNQLLYRTPFSKRVIRNVSLPPTNTRTVAHPLSLSHSYESFRLFLFLLLFHSLIRSTTSTNTGMKEKAEKTAAGNNPTRQSITYQISCFDGFCYCHVTSLRNT